MHRTIAIISIVLALSFAPGALAKRRSVRSAPAAPAPPAGNCHTFGLVAAGTKATYLSTTSGGNATFTITWISDTPTQTHTTQKTTTAQGTTDVDTVLDGEVVGNLRGLKHIHTKSVTPIPVIGSSTIEVDIDFVPSLIAGPAQGWCTGATWTISPVTETVVTRGTIPLPTQIVTTVGSTGEVLAVGESLTTPAGTFQTVKYRSAQVNGSNVQPSITWVSMEYNIVVKQDTLDAAGNVTSTTTLQSIP